MSETRGSGTMAVAVVVVSGLLGGIFGGRVLAGQDSLDEQYEVFATALAAIETTYVGEVDSEQLVYRATGGLRHEIERPCVSEVVGSQPSARLPGRGPLGHLSR